ncbi:hypothetical protein EDC01DRAFT_781110 [Geopyxis carbonaria]|nr:hypothetical protein EDC01DRAFT_781110 [Geopyxis carbonaria]
MVGQNACAVDVPEDWKISAIMGGDDFKPIEIILDEPVHKGNKEYFVKFAGLSLSRTEWLKASELHHERQLFAKFESSFKPLRYMKRNLETAARQDSKKMKG